MNITLKEIPTDLHAQLRERAEMNGRSLNKEIIFMLERIVNPARSNPGELYLQIRQHRDELPSLVKEEELRDLIDSGRA